MFKEPFSEISFRKDKIEAEIEGIAASMLELCVG